MPNLTSTQWPTPPDWPKSGNLRGIPLAPTTDTPKPAHPNRFHTMTMPVLLLTLPDGTQIHGYARLRKLRPGPTTTNLI